MIDLFNNISKKNKEKILRDLEAQTRFYKKNSKILTTVKWDDVIGIVLDGYMQLIRTDYNGNRTILDELVPGSIFGTVLSSLKNMEYEIITKEDTKLIIIEYSYIIDQIANNNAWYYNQFKINLLEIFYDKIREENERISILTKKSIRDKLLEYFRIVSKKTGSKRIYITLGYSELADYLSVDRCAMSRELTNLKDEGFIKKDGKKITLLY